MKATIDGNVIAAADDSDLIVIEGNYYFPPSSLTSGVLSTSVTLYTCPWKGAAKYHDLRVGTAVHLDAAWSYPEPYPAAFERVGRDFTDFVAFDTQQVAVS